MRNKFLYLAPYGANLSIEKFGNTVQLSIGHHDSHDSRAINLPLRIRKELIKALQSTIPVKKDATK
jgi:hypothetical protein